jgi:hypothetical protein
MERPWTWSVPTDADQRSGQLWTAARQIASAASGPHHPCGSSSTRALAWYQHRQPGAPAFSARPLAYVGGWSACAGPRGTDSQRSVRCCAADLRRRVGMASHSKSGSVESWSRKSGGITANGIAKMVRRKSRSASDPVAPWSLRRLARGCGGARDRCDMHPGRNACMAPDAWGRVLSVYPSEVSFETSEG